MGSQYLKAYALDCAIAGVHFCFSGYFCAYGKSTVSFLHNLISMAAVRVPGAYQYIFRIPCTLWDWRRRRARFCHRLSVWLWSCISERGESDSPCEKGHVFAGFCIGFKNGTRTVF